MTDAGNAPISSPAARVLVLRIAWPATAVTALATSAFFHMYATAKVQAAFIEVHNLPFSPPDPAPALAGGILGVSVTLLLGGTIVEVASGKRIVDMPHLAAARLAAFVRSARREVPSATVAGTTAVGPASADRAGVQESVARRPFHARLA